MATTSDHEAQARRHGQLAKAFREHGEFDLMNEELAKARRENLLAKDGSGTGVSLHDSTAAPRTIQLHGTEHAAHAAVQHLEQHGFNHPQSPKHIGNLVAHSLQRVFDRPVPHVPVHANHPFVVHANDLTHHRFPGGQSSVGSLTKPLTHAEHREMGQYHAQVAAHLKAKGVFASEQSGHLAAARYHHAQAQPRLL